MPEDNQPQAPPVPEQPTPQTPPTLPTPTSTASNGYDSTPVVSQPVVSAPVVMSQKSKKPLWFALIAAVLVLGAAAGYVFGFYLPNTPSNVYNASLVNSGKALDNIVSYSKLQQQADYKATTLNGSLKVKSASGSYDFNLTGTINKNADADIKADADILGEKATATIRSVHASDNTTPDIYFQLSGIKSFLDSSGLSALDTLDGQWIVVDHTLTDTYLASLKQQLKVDNKADSTTVAPSYAAIQDAVAKTQAVNRQYIFTTDQSKAVLTNQKFVGKETQSGRTFNHYTVSYDKTHLQAYAHALASALDSSQLNDWSKKANDGKSLSQVMDFASLETDISKAKTDYTFDLWADTKTKLVSKATFTDPSDKSSVFSLSQGYTGGSSYPFGLEFVGKDENGNDQKGTASLTVDTKTNKVTVKFSTDLASEGEGTTTFSADFTAAPSNTPATVTAPSGAKSVLDVANQLGLTDLFSGPSASSDLLQSI